MFERVEVGLEPEVRAEVGPPWSPELTAERLRVILGFGPSLWWWRVDLSQLGWVPIGVGVFGVALDGALGRLYLALMVSLAVAFMLRREWVEETLAAKADAAARRELVPVAERLLDEFPETLVLLESVELSDTDRAAMVLWARGVASRARRL